MARLTVERFPDDLFKRLKAAAAMAGVTMGLYVEEAVIARLAADKPRKAGKA